MDDRWRLDAQWRPDTKINCVWFYLYEVSRISRLIETGQQRSSRDWGEGAQWCRRRGFDPWVTEIPGEENGSPLQGSCLETPVDRGAWRAAAHGVSESDTTDDWTISSLGEVLFNEWGVSVWEDETVWELMMVVAQQYGWTYSWCI